MIIGTLGQLEGRTGRGEGRCSRAAGLSEPVVVTAGGSSGRSLVEHFVDTSSRNFYGPIKSWDFYRPKSDWRETLLTLVTRTLERTNQFAVSFVFLQELNNIPRLRCQMQGEPPGKILT